MDINCIYYDSCHYVNFDKNVRVYNTIMMDNDANVHMFSDKMMLTKNKNKNVAAYVIAAGGQNFLILRVGDIYNLKDVFTCARNSQTNISVTFLAGIGCSYFGQYDNCTL